MKRGRWVEGLLSAWIAAAAVLAAAPPARADEGMWTFDHLPLRQLEERYGFTPTPEWIAHLQHSAVRVGGASGSFVSADGLVLTNHHVAADTLQKLSTPQNNYYEHGFLARTQGEELKAPDLELNQLIAIEDVTDQINAAEIALAR